MAGFEPAASPCRGRATRLRHTPARCSGPSRCPFGRCSGSSVESRTPFPRSSGGCLTNRRRNHIKPKRNRSTISRQSFLSRLSGGERVLLPCGIGRDCRIRTDGLMSPRHALHQAELNPVYLLGRGGRFRRFHVKVPSAAGAQDMTPRNAYPHASGV